VALKVFNADVSQDRARAELRAAQAIDSPYAERVESLGHWRGERFFLAMNLVEAHLCARKSKPKSFLSPNDLLRSPSIASSCSPAPQPNSGWQACSLAP